MTLQYVMLLLLLLLLLLTLQYGDHTLQVQQENKVKIWIRGRRMRKRLLMFKVFVNRKVL